MIGVHIAQTKIMSDNVYHFIMNNKNPGKELTESSSECEDYHFFLESVHQSMSDILL